MAFKVPSLIGVIHLPALPGAPGSSRLSAEQALMQAGDWAVLEAKKLQSWGFDALILENFGDVPFYKSQVPPETIASLAILASAIRSAVSIPIGINVLRNDARAALAIAAVSGCDFIRVNVLSGVAATDQGMIEGEASFLLRERERLGASHVGILGDVHVKHAQSLSSHDIALGVEEIALRAGADAVILTGSTTGRPVNLQELQEASSLAKKHSIPVLLGSGVTSENWSQYQPYAQGVIVGSALRKNGKAGAPLDQIRAKKFVQAFKLAKKAKKKPGRKK